MVRGARGEDPEREGRGMSAKAAGQVNRDAELGGDAGDAIDARISTALKDVHTNMPGMVKSFDPVTQTATVQPMLMRVFIPDGARPLPLCTDVPVILARWGNFIMTGPVSEGDPCVIHISERAIDYWFDRGGVQEPSEVRFHHLSDAFAQPGGSSKPQAAQVVGGVSTTGVEIRTLDGTVVLRLDDDAVTAGDLASAEAAIKGDKLSAYLDVIATALNGLAPGAVLLYSAIAGNPTLDYKATKAKVG